MKVINQLLKFRYLIAVILIAFSVSMGWHGSSINNWGNFGVSERVDGMKEVVPQIVLSQEEPLPKLAVSGLYQWATSGMKSDTIVLGVPRMIRSDEWIVQTPFYLSQVEQSFPVVNQNYGISGQNMIVAYNAPVKDISIIGKPFNWGFLFLGAEKGLSWYWSFKLITLFLLAYEFSLILTKGQKLLSLLGAAWITFTPSIQWWFMQHLGDIVYFSLLAMVSIFHYFKASHVFKKLVFASLISISLIGFILVIYPAFQVPFAYLILGIFCTSFYAYLTSGNFQKHDLLILSLSFLVVILVSGWAIAQSWDALQATLNTVYPGQRVSVGGELDWKRLPEFIVSAVLPFSVPPALNQVELSHSINFLPTIILGIPFFIKSSLLRKNPFIIFMLCYSLWLLAYAIFPFPTILSKATLFSYVTGARAWQSLSVIAVFLSIWFVSYLWEKCDNNKLTWSFLGLISFIPILGIALQNDLLLEYAGRKVLIISTIWFIFSIVLAVYRLKKSFVVSLLALIFLSGMTVNPIIKGLGGIYDKKLSQAILRIKEKDSDALWISEGALYNYLPIFGVHSLNSVRFYPDSLLMQEIDPKNANEDFWNRYAHMRVSLSTGEGVMTNPAPDVLEMSMGINELSQLKVSYVLSHKLTYENFKDVLTPVYGPDKDGNMILKVKRGVSD